MTPAEGKAMHIGGFAGAGGGGSQWHPSANRRAFRASLVVAALLSTGLLGGCSGLVNGTKSVIQAAFQLNPTSVNFGKVTIGKQSTQTVSISNTGNTSISITQATFSNPQFSLSGVTLPMSMATGQTGSLTVAVTPTATGSITGTMTVQGSDGSSPASVNLTANAAPSGPQISLSSSSVQFGTVAVNSTVNSNVTVANNGSADLTISLISVTGADFGESGLSTPKTISSNDPNNPTVTVSLDGTGSTTAGGQLQSNPTALSFGNVATGSSSTKQITLSNPSSVAVQISSITATGAGLSVNGISFPWTLNPSATVNFNVVFAPTSAGSVTGSVKVTSNANGSPMTIAVTGTGVQSGLSVSPASFNFGSVVDGQTKSQTFTLTNTGNTSLTISQLAVSGVGYSVTGLNPPSNLAAGASTTFSAVFAPTTAGSLTGSVTVTSTAPNSPATVSLSGTGVASTVNISANPTSLSFGNVNAGSSSSKTVVLTNSGNSSITISQVTVSAKDVTESGFTLPITLSAGQTQTMNVQFNPTAAENVAGNITITNSQGSSTVIPVNGTGLQAGISLTPSSASFGNVAVGAANSQTIQISNTGNATLTITQAGVTGAGFSTSGLGLPLSVNPGQSSTFNAQF